MPPSLTLVSIAVTGSEPTVVRDMKEYEEVAKRLVGAPWLLQALGRRVRDARGNCQNVAAAVATAFALGDPPSSTDAADGPGPPHRSKSKDPGWTPGRSDSGLQESPCTQTSRSTQASSHAVDLLTWPSEAAAGIWRLGLFTQRFEATIRILWEAHGDCPLHTAHLVARSFKLKTPQLTGP